MIGVRNGAAPDAEEGAIGPRGSVYMAVTLDGLATTASHRVLIIATVQTVCTLAAIATTTSLVRRPRESANEAVSWDCGVHAVIKDANHIPTVPGARTDAATVVSIRPVIR